jgi:tape measure domain-containing protein
MSIGETTSLTVLLKGDITRLEASLRRAEGRLAKTNSYMKNMTSQVSGYFGAMFAVGAVVQFGRSQVELVKQIDQSNRSLKAIIGTGLEYNRVKLMLSDSAQNLGINVLDLTKSYVRFIAAAKGSTLAGDELDSIFNKVSKSTAVLGLSADETHGVLKALEQMLSKGKVQAEELRGQLGDRLPGAFVIMAQSMGVTTGELDKMLKMGGVLADEVLPKFADAVVKAYGADSIKHIETLNAAIGRTETAWVKLIEKVDSGDGPVAKSIGMWQGLKTALYTNIRGADNFMDLLTVAGMAVSGVVDLGAALRILKGDQEELEAATEASKEQTEHLTQVFEILKEKGVKSNDDLFESLKKVSGGYELVADGRSLMVLTQEELNELTKIYTDVADKAKKAELARAEALLKSKTAQEAATKAIEAAIKAEEKLLAAKKETGLYQYLEQEFANSEFQQKNKEVDAELSLIFGTGEADFGEVADEYQKAVDNIAATVEEANEKLSESTMAFQSAVINIGTDIIGGFAEALASGDIQGYFDGLMGVIGKGMSELGRSLIAIGIAEKIAATSFDPAAKIAAGAALVFLGAKFSASSKKLANNVAGRGGGGGGGSFGSNLTGQSINISGETVIRGRDLAYVFDQNKKDFRAKANF